MTNRAATMPYSASIDEVTRLTGLSKTKLYGLLAEGKLQGKKHGRRTLVMMDGVRAYVDALPNANFGESEFCRTATPSTTSINRSPSVR